MGWFHRHRWQVSGAHQLQWANGCPCTEILMVCDCGALKTINLTGSWTLEQLQPNATKEAADKRFFKNLGVKL